MKELKKTCGNVDGKEKPPTVSVSAKKEGERYAKAVHRICDLWFTTFSHSSSL
jgi:hypothetical protein